MGTFLFFNHTSLISLFFFFRVNDFEDGNHFYRFLEHEPFIPRCHNFRGSTNDFEPKAAASISLRLTKIMSAILESYASEDGRHLNYVGISNSEEFRRQFHFSSNFLYISRFMFIRTDLMPPHIQAWNLLLANVQATISCFPSATPGSLIEYVRKREIDKLIKKHLSCKPS